MDTIDNKILKILNEDGRSSASTIANEVNLSVPAVGDRIKKLQESGIILGFKPIIDSNEVGLGVAAFITVYSESSKNFTLLSCQCPSKWTVVSFKIQPTVTSKTFPSGFLLTGSFVPEFSSFYLIQSLSFLIYPTYYLQTEI